MYTSHDLVEALRKQPFEPLELQLSNGERIYLTHPDQAFVTSTRSLILLTPAKEPGTYDWRLIGLDHVLGVSHAMRPDDVNGK